MRRQVEVRQRLLSAGRRVLAQVVVPASRQNGLDVASISMRSESQVVLVHAKAGFEQGPAAEIVLVLQRTEVGGFDFTRGGRLRHQSPHSGVWIMKVIRQKAGGHDVAGGEIG